MRSGVGVRGERRLCQQDMWHRFQVSRRKLLRRRTERNRNGHRLRRWRLSDVRCRRRLRDGRRLSERRVRRRLVPKSDVLGRREERVRNRHRLRRTDVQQVRHRGRMRNGRGLPEQRLQRREMSGADVLGRREERR